MYKTFLVFRILVRGFGALSVNTYEGQQKRQTTITQTLCSFIMLKHPCDLDPFKLIYIEKPWLGFSGVHIILYNFARNIACVRNFPNGTIGNFTNGTIGSQWYHW